MPKNQSARALRFDWLGFGVLALGIGALQMMLDRGQDQDWFASTEIITEAVLAGLGIYLFVVHMLTAEKPFMPPAIFRDMNFVVSVALMFAVGMVLLASSALLAPWLQNLSNFPVETAGLLLAPRGVGTMAAMFIGGRLSTRIDPRLFIALGILLLCGSLWGMTGWTPDVSQSVVVTNIIIQGAGLGFVFIPLQVLAFATLPALLRTDGTALLSLSRNVGSAIGVSATSALLTRNAQVLHEQIGSYVTPFNRALQAVKALNPATRHGAALLDSIISQQAQVIAYLDDFKFLVFTSLPALLLLLLLRRPSRTQIPPADLHAAMD
jgi:DHA2 family multidrug resistance protein